MKKKAILILFLLCAAALSAQQPSQAQNLPTGVQQADTVPFRPDNSYEPNTAREVLLYRQFADNPA